MAIHDPLNEDRVGGEPDILARLANFADLGVMSRPQQSRDRTVRFRAIQAGLLVGAMALSSLATYWLMERPSRPDTPPNAAAAPAAAAGAPPSSGLEISGYAVARNKASVSADITGRIRSIAVEVGQVVQVGQVIAVLDDREALLNLEAARIAARRSLLEIESANVALDLNGRQRERSKELSSRGFVSRAVQDEADSKLKGSQILLRQRVIDHSAAINTLRTAEIIAQRHVIRAPFTGIVDEVTARPGETVSPISGGGSFIRSGIVQLIDPKSLYVIAEIPEKQVAGVRTGQPVRLSGAGFSKPFLSKISWIAPESNRQRGVVEVGIGLDTEIPTLRDGMEVDVKVMDQSIVSATRPQ